MNTHQYKEAIVLMFTEWCKSQKELDGEKITVRDFDVWICGYIHGISLNNEELSNEDAHEISEHLVNTEIAKSLGILGTEKEKISDGYLAIR